MFKKIIDELLFRTISCDDMPKVKAQIMAENAKYVRVWAIAEMLYWAFCMVMTLKDEAYMLCRNIYLAAFITCTVALALASFAAPKRRWVIWPAALALQIAIMVSGVFIARNLAPKTIVVFASVLIVPVMYITDTMSTLILMILNIILLRLVGKGAMDPETFQWTFTNLIIFSSIGLLISHFVNKARFERYVFAQSAVQLAETNARLAELQTRYAYFDQLTGLQNRRAYAEKVEELEKNLPVCCVISADINGLKAANDTYGHETGDALLVGAAECLRKGFEGFGTIYRIGGDEFCILMNGTEADVENCLKRLEKVCAAWKGKNIDGISISVGYATAGEFPDLDSILKAADERMYESKRNYYRIAACDRRKR